ncbi:MAG: hypothetical protein SFX73_17775 [Kofleriaceae bacterium]|nr:hypothetical protein [Kofleriaceae bacterium]
MSPLAFDKQGKPFAWHQRTAKLRVRLFRNPAARGTCCQVLDASGSPLFVDAGIEYAEFRRITGNVPGLYRLDQCDEDGVDIEGAPAGYLTIEPLRNGGALSTTDAGASLEVNALAIIERLVAVQERMFASQADVMKQMTAQHGVLMNAGSVAMHASAEIMRAPYRAPLALPEPRNAGSNEEAEDEDARDDAQVEPEPDPSPLSVAMSFITPEMAHQLGAGAVEKIIEAFKWIFGPKQPDAAAPAVAPAAPPAPGFVAPFAPSVAPVSVAQAGVAAGPSSRTASEPVVVGSIFEAYEPRFADADGVEPEADSYAEDNHIEETAQVTPAPSAQVAPTHAPNPLIANAASAAPVATTKEQFGHLMAIYQRLSPGERAIAQRTVAQMNVATRSQWITALSAKSVDEAVADLRGVLARM